MLGLAHAASSPSSGFVARKNSLCPSSCLAGRPGLRCKQRDRAVVKRVVLENFHNTSSVGRRPRSFWRLSHQQDYRDHHCGEDGQHLKQIDIGQNTRLRLSRLVDLRKGMVLRIV